MLCVYLTSIYLSINERLYYPSEWTRLKSRNTPERGRGMSGHAAGTLWVSNPRIESPCVAERRRSVGGPHVGRFSLAWWWLRAPYGDPILRPRMVPYRVSNPSRRTSGRSARAPSRATSSHPLAGGPQSEVRRGADFLTRPVRPCVLRPRHRPPRLLPWSSAAPCLSSVGAGRPPAVGLVQCTRCTPGVWGLPSGACSPSPCNGVFLPGHVIPHGTARVAVVPSDTSSSPLTSRVLFQPPEHGS